MLALLLHFTSNRFLHGADVRSEGIPIAFHLDKPGYVTLVVDDSHGIRVRNLLGGVPFSTGDHVVYWDGLDDRTPDTNAAAHGVYHIAGHLVSPGIFRIRGLVRPELTLTYELTPYTHGNPPWRSSDPSSEWLANHTPPSAVLFLPAGSGPVRSGKPASTGPQILVGSYVTEGGSGLAWLDLEGNKLYGQMWLDGVWAAATHLARDSGLEAKPGVYAYAAAAWEDSLRLVELLDLSVKQKKPADPRLGRGGDHLLLDPPYKFPKELRFTDLKNRGGGVGGLAVHNGLLVASLPALGRLLFVDAIQARVLGTEVLNDPRGLAFGTDGRLLAVSGRQVLAFGSTASASPTMPVGPPVPLIVWGLEDPQQIAVGPDGRILVSDWGNSHQVKVFAASGVFLEAIGRAGRPGVGRYDPQHMIHPYGMTVDGLGHIWVAEQDEAPKRISEWDFSGRLIRAFYGPAQYGGGGIVDPEDKTRFFYADKGGGIEFKLDYKASTAKPVGVYYRPELNPIAPGWPEPPETPIHLRGRTYLTDAYTANATNGITTASLWILEAGVARPVAAVGQTTDPMVLGEARVFGAKRPLHSGGRDIFVWSDLNGDGRMEPDEIQFMSGRTGSVLVMPDLTFTTGSGLVLKPISFTRSGVPVYDVSKVARAPVEPQERVSTGGGQMLEDEAGRLVFTTAPRPLSAYGFGGVENGAAAWHYLSLWPGLHASHIAPKPGQPSELIGTTRVLGPPFRLPGLVSGEIWAVNGNHGNIYLFTTDGLFVATLFQDYRGAAWDVPVARRGMPVGQFSLGEECFFTTITETTSGEIYLQSGFYGQIVRLAGLDGLRRLPDREIFVDATALSYARSAFERRESERRKSLNRAVGVASIPELRAPPNLERWPSGWDHTQWLEIDSREVRINDWSRRKIYTKATLAVVGDRLYAVFQTDDPDLIKNSGAAPQFASGGGLDLMIGANPKADPHRREPAIGDERLLVFTTGGRMVALLYRPVVQGGSSRPWKFSSPVRTVRCDQVEDVSGEVRLSTRTVTESDRRTKEALFEISVPLEVLGIGTDRHRSIRGDIGVLRGDGVQTLQRSYWSNKETGLVSDIPSEAELTPNLWGEWRFE